MLTLCYNETSFLKGGPVLAILLSVAVSAPVPPDIIPLMLARIRSDTAASQSLEYTQERTEYEVRNGIDRLKKRESRAVRGTGTGFLKQLIMKNGKPVVGAQVEPLDTAMIELVNKYDFAPVMADTVSVDGFDCWQVSFTPRANLEDRSDEDAILNHIEGTAFVDAHNYLVRAIRATQSSPFRRGFLGAARFNSINLDTRQIEWDDGKHVGIQTTTVIRVRYAVIGDTYLRVEHLNTNHRWQP